MSEPRVPWTWAAGDVKGNSSVAPVRCHTPSIQNTSGLTQQTTYSCRPSLHLTMLICLRVVRLKSFTDIFNTLQKHLTGTVSAHFSHKHMKEYLCMWQECCQFLSDRSYQASKGWYDVMCSAYSIFQMKALWTSSYINMHYHVLTPALFFHRLTLRQPSTTLAVNTAQTNWREIIPALML